VASSAAGRGLGDGRDPDPLTGHLRRRPQLPHPRGRNIRLIAPRPVRQREIFKEGVEASSANGKGYQFHIGPSREQAIREAAPALRREHEDVWRIAPRAAILTDERIAAIRNPALVGTVKLPTIKDAVEADGFHYRGAEDGQEALSSSRPRQLRHTARHPARHVARRPRPLREGGVPALLRYSHRRHGAVDPVDQPPTAGLQRLQISDGRSQVRDTDGLVKAAASWPAGRRTLSSN